MYVLVSLGWGRLSVELGDEQNFRELSVRSAGVHRPSLAKALSEQGFGELAGDHVWLETTVLRVAGPWTPEWTTAFDAMLAGAARHGWVSPDGSRVRAHLEPA